MSTQPVERKYKVLAFVALHHVQQKRKYTGEPYLNHLRSVAEAAKDKAMFGFEIGLCHDLLEDTICTALDLYDALKRFGYDRSEAIFIVSRVEDLTDVYTTEKYPHVNRAARKKLEALRLHNVHQDSQTVKYCDLIDNTSSIVEHDKGFAIKYIAEKEDILKGMNKGEKSMYKNCLKSLEIAKQKLKIN